ncbi:bacteriocin/lantibiotic exporter permease [Acetobacter nitrogenifigens DSM 23921 = NBRC 105050]|uniref:Toxin transporter n=1 Tax=Acetobacter nitrogenifigens DSM 23921 = NBRC 105050 TaxID=1120919 RepID=A0A511XCP9_9PROT|nr:peptidase domain-containing ABC transporter [Acetobacter nitrogenifigens]GBQ87756.1 bacteriocin/lantibiotic exporter permease [Acetobacter nitrogenifigens DSM 23921 = NBRC 105050]GEN60738.1 toxin transporter [Acetobacter nitrogenifigens DSM 23921 = NBRC 105050]
MSDAFDSLQFGFGKSTPVILQVEAAECGLACLAMIMGYHGHPIDLATLRRRYSVSIKGVTLRSLVQVADMSGFSTRAVRLEMDDLRNLRLPCVLHWGMNHFVVLTAIKGDQITINDPAVGRRTLPLDAVSREFTGVALEVTPNETFERKDERETIRLRDLFRHVGGLRGALTGLFMLSMGLEVISLITPMISQVVIDEVIVTSDYDLLKTIAFGLGLLLLLQMFIGSVRTWAVTLLGTRVGLDWNTSLFDHLTRLPLDYFGKRHVGDILSRFGSLGTIQQTLTTDMVQTVMDGIMAIGMGIMLFLYGGWLGLVACVATVLDIILRLVTYRIYREASEEQIVVNARQQTHFIETLRGIASVKLLGLRERRRSTWLNLVIESINIRLRLQRFDLIYGRLGDFIFGADRLIMMVLGARAVMTGSMSVGMLVAFLSYKDQFASRIGALINTGFKLRMLNIQSDRLADIVMTDPEPLAHFEPELAPGAGSLVCRGMSARYATHEPWIFRGVDLDVPAGMSVAIVGPSGCGKTTMLKAMMGLLKLDEGSLFLDGTDVAALTLEGYRRRIAGVLQDDGLFSGSIADNICGFSEHPDQELMLHCAAQAAILDDIKRMPMGFETLVGDMGGALSGGQKQRVILARALYTRPHILFLDEATSHLDEHTESIVADSLRRLNVTRVMVAHRPATIAHADYIYYLQPGGSLVLKKAPDVQSAPKPVAAPMAATIGYGGPSQYGGNWTLPSA